jgi:hypothetical protein
MLRFSLFLVSVYLYLFICSSFSDTVNSADSMASNDWIILNNELERIWEEAVIGLI